MQVLLKLIIYTVLVAAVWGTCDVCQGRNHVACHSRNCYSLCINGKATEDYITCPENFICTSDVLVCYPEASARATCERSQIRPHPSGGSNLCGVCDGHKVFACLNETTIAFCFGADMPVQESLSYCPEGTVCDITRESGFCSDSALVKPSCTGPHIPEEQDTPTQPSTPGKPRNPNEICQEGGSTGLHPTDDDTTCTKFVVCYLMEGTLYGIEKTCPAGEYFHQENGLCAADKPEGCPDQTVTTDTTPTTTDSADTTPTTVDSTNTTPTKPTETAPQDPRDPTTICQDEGSTGSYKTDDDDTCTKFVICYILDGTLHGLAKTCPTGQYFHPEKSICETDKPEACLTEADTTNTTPASESTKTTPEGSRDPNKICQDAGSTGSYTTDDDDTCTKFVICYILDGTLHGLAKTCPTGQYFHPETRICQTEKPEVCFNAAVTTNTTPAIVESTKTTQSAAGDPRDPNKICQDAGSTGSYMTDDDVTCTKFVVCYILSGTLQGLQKSCPSGQYFHPEKRLCIPDKPEGC